MNDVVKKMSVLNFHNFITFLFILVYAVEEGGFNFETIGVPMQYVELRCERAFSELYMAVSFVDETKLVCKSPEFWKIALCYFKRSKKLLKNLSEVLSFDVVL